MNRRYFAIIVLLSLLALRNDASSQILFDPGNSVQLQALDCTWSNFTFTFTETSFTDFPGETKSGGFYFYSLRIQLPAGFEFNTAANITASLKVGGDLEFHNTIAKQPNLLEIPLKVNNNVATHDELFLYNVQIRMTGTPCPSLAMSGNLTAGLSSPYSANISPSTFIVSNNGSLPVELTSFTAMLRNETVALKWSTATETNNYGFDVERSFDRENWEKIGFVAGSGTTSSQRDYTFDARLAQRDMQQELLSFRLRQIDRDGSIDYSPEVSVSPAGVAGTVELKQNFPNPFNPATNISFNLPASDVVSLSVYNELGVEVARIHDGTQLERGWHTASFNATELPSGLYMYRLQTSAGTSSRTMMLMK